VPPIARLAGTVPAASAPDPAPDPAVPLPVSCCRFIVQLPCRVAARDPGDGAPPSPAVDRSHKST